MRGELEKLLSSESMGVVVRSRHKENLENEKASLFFSQLHELKIDGQIISDKKTIEKSVLKYLGALFNGLHLTKLCCSTRISGWFG